jgi:hypothetical protein
MKLKLIICMVYLFVFCSSFETANNSIIANRLSKIIELIQKDSLTANTMCDGKLNNMSFVFDTITSYITLSHYYQDYTLIKLLIDTNVVDTNSINTRPKRRIWLTKFDNEREKHYLPVCIDSKNIYGKEKGKIYCKIYFDVIQDRIFALYLDKIFPPHGYYRAMNYIVVFNRDNTVAYFKSSVIME